MQGSVGWPFGRTQQSEFEALQVCADEGSNEGEGEAAWSAPLLRKPGDEGRSPISQRQIKSLDAQPVRLQEKHSAKHSSSGNSTGQSEDHAVNSGGESSFGATWSSSSNEGSDDLPVGAAADSGLGPDAIATAGAAATPARTSSSRPLVWPRLGSRSKLPSQQQAQRFYKYMLPFSLAQLALMVVPVLYAVFNPQPGQRPGQIIVGFLSGTPAWVALGACGTVMASTVMTYLYHYGRLYNWQATPELPPVSMARPLTHVVIVCSYKEPTAVLLKTFESIAAQRGLHKAPIAVLAAEERDKTRHASFPELEIACKGRLARLFMTEHALQEGEPAGKASNENFAAREVYRRLVEEEGLDPFEVIVTIADADSIFSPTYLAEVESAYHSEPDGRRLIYKGPLNVYRNFADAGLLVQCLELARCHTDAFHSPFQVPYPYSNYSLALGFASEIGFWTPDCMPEDIHTANKAIVNSFGSRATVLVSAVVCNDLVPTIADRYSQAKRHQWGSVTEWAWIWTLLADTKMRFPAWCTVAVAEGTRAGSLVGAIGCLASVVVQACLVLVLSGHWEVLPPSAVFVCQLMGIVAVWQWLWFWMAEFTLWNTILRQFPIERPPWWQWLLLIALMPAASAINICIFYILPTLHALFHATFIGHELAYIVAPKGDAARSGRMSALCYTGSPV